MVLMEREILVLGASAATTTSGHKSIIESSSEEEWIFYVELLEVWAMIISGGVEWAGNLLLLTDWEVCTDSCWRQHNAEIWIWVCTKYCIGKYFHLMCVCIYTWNAGMNTWTFTHVHAHVLHVFVCEHTVTHIRSHAHMHKHTHVCGT